MRMMELHTNAEWLAGYRRGDAESLARVYETYAQALIAMLKRGIGSSSDGRRVRIRVEDEDERLEIVHETFARVFADKTRARYNGQTPFLPYLSMICRNVVVDRYRLGRRDHRVFAPDGVETGDGELLRRTEAAGDPAESLSAMGRSPEDLSHRRQLAALLSDFMQTLDPEEVELLRLYYWDDASQRKAAAAMDVDRNKVRDLIARIRLRLLRHLRKQGAIEGMDVQDILNLLMLFVPLGDR